MDIIGGLRDKRRTVEEEKTPPKLGFTLTEIMKDSPKSQLFGELLRVNGEEELAQRLAEGNLEEGDISSFEEQRILFTKKMLQVEEVEGILTQEQVIELARRHPDFQNIVNLVGPEKAAKVIKAQLKEMSINDPDRFQPIADSLRAIKEFQDGKYKTLNIRVLNYCKNHDIDPRKLTDILAIENEEDRERALQDLVGYKTDGLKWWSGAKNFFSGAKGRLDYLSQANKDINDASKKLDELHKQSGRVLSSTIIEEDSLRKLLAQEIKGEKQPKVEKKTGFGEANKEKTEIDEKKLNTDWEAYKDGANFNFDELNSGEQENLRSLFLEDQREQYAKKKGKEEGGGFWDRVFSILFEKNLKSKVENLK